MMEPVIYSLAAAVIAFLVSSGAIPLVRRIALAARAVDYPGGRRDQAGAIPRLGGVAAVLGLLVSIACLAALQPDAWLGQATTTQLVAVPLALFIIFLCGFVEDIAGFSPLCRFLMQSIAAILVIKAGWCFGSLNLPFFENLDLGIFGGPLSLIWIVGVTNAINLLDGLDGLAVGVAAIIASSMLVLSLWHGDFATAAVMGAIAGACLGFLRKNWAPAQIYLGDAGSLTLGFVLAVASVQSSIKAPTAVAILVPMLALGLPVIDTLLVMLFRFTRRTRGPLAKRCARVFRADRCHLHHLMLCLAPNRSRIVVVIYVIAVLFCGMAVVVAVWRNVIMGFAFVGIQIVIVSGIRYLGLHSDALAVSLERRREAREILNRQRSKTQRREDSREDSKAPRLEGSRAQSLEQGKGGVRVA